MQGLDIKKPNPGISLPWLITLIAKLLMPILSAITPVLRDALEDFVKDYYKKSLETDNPWDDFLALFLARMLNIPVSEG